MRSSYTFKIGGPAGLGIMTTGLMFSKVAARSGFHVFDYTEYPSLIRGGHNVMEVHFSQDEVHAQEQGIDLLVALNRETVHLHKAHLKKGAGVVYDPDLFSLTVEDVGSEVSLFPVPLQKIIEETGIKKIMENNITLGAAVGIFGLRIETIYSIIDDTFADKGEEVIIANKHAADAGFHHVVTRNYQLRTIVQPLEPSDQIIRDYAIITGNEAIGMGALMGGCQLYVAYPMTPSSSVLHYLAEHAKNSGMVVRHAEDEIGVINEAIGASFAGARAMVGTSGGGFALMNEALSLAGITETPLVVFVGQRPGPATGMPTWTEQGDLQFIIRSGHGEFPKIVLAPGDPLECVELTAQAFNLADIYQTVVIIVSDKFLAESHKGVSRKNILDFNAQFAIDRGKIEYQTNEQEILPYPRYQDSEDGISKRVLPGTKGYYYQANSYEHSADGHTTEDSNERIQQVNKRFRKSSTYIQNHFKPPVLYGAENPDIMLIGWGGMKGPALDALKILENTSEGRSIGYLHFTHIWPMNSDLIAQILRNQKKLILIENNATAQFGQLIRQETGISIEHKLLKYDGRPIYPSEIIDFIKTI